MGLDRAVAQVRSAVRPLLTGSVLVACSGGPDSLALAAAVAFEAPRRGITAGLVTIDHGLQPQSAAQARRVAGIGYELGFDPVEIVAVAVGRTGGREAAARAARYAALDAAAQALDADVLLGHTLDDQAETVLLGLGRGSGPRSVAGMRARNDRYLRPFLGLRRATTVAACSALGLQPWDDPHNADPALQRVRLRHEVLPLLEDVLQGGVTEALARTADLLQDDLDALDTLSSMIMKESLPWRTAVHDHRTGELVAAGLEPLPRALRTRILRSWALVAGAAEITAVHAGELDALVTDWHGQGPLDLPGLRVRRTSGRLVAEPPPAQE
jgi:tRNA(Ile)-lysidine synthase